MEQKSTSNELHFALCVCCFRIKWEDVNQPKSGGGNLLDQELQKMLKYAGVVYLKLRRTVEVMLTGNPTLHQCHLLPENLSHPELASWRRPGMEYTVNWLLDYRFVPACCVVSEWMSD